MLVFEFPIKLFAGIYPAMMKVEGTVLLVPTYS